MDLSGLLVASGKYIGETRLVATVLTWSLLFSSNDTLQQQQSCKAEHPPGRKVYQRGAHTIWEIDGAEHFVSKAARLKDALLRDTEWLFSAFLSDLQDYCLNLCLFGKLFIDHKTLYFDVDPFYFYVVTNGEGASNFDKPYGYFSKVRQQPHKLERDYSALSNPAGPHSQEKQSYEDYNLACIVTFPPYQRQGWGAMMMEFSEWFLVSC